MTHIHIIRHKGPATCKYCPVVLNLNIRALPLNSEVQFQIAPWWGRDKLTSLYVCGWGETLVRSGWTAYLCVCVCRGTGSSGLNVERTHWSKEGEAGEQKVEEVQQPWGNRLRHTCDCSLQYNLHISNTGLRSTYGKF